MEASLSVEAAVDRLCQLTGAPAKTQGDEVQTGCPMCQNDTHHLYVTRGVNQAILVRCVKNEEHGPEIIRRFFPPPAPTNGNGKHPSGATNRYEYHDAQGNLRFFVEVTRYPDGRKESRMGQPGPRGDRWDLHGVTPCLWHLPRLQGLPAGSLVLLPEGEKDVLALERAGFAASTNAGGCGGWKASLVEPLRPFRVTVVADADLPGKRLAERKQVDLIAAGIDCRVLDLGYPIQEKRGKDVSDWLREHSPAELAALVQAAWQAPVVVPEAPPERFRFVRLPDLKSIPSPNWQVEGMFEEQSLIVLFGPSGSGKTFLAGSISLGLITGSGWFGVPVLSGPVVYVNADGGAGFIQRVNAWLEEAGEKHPYEFLTVNEPVNLFLTHEVIEFAERIKALPAEQQPKLIVFDTLARCMAGGDENSTSDVGIVIRNLNYLQRELQTSCMVVHHTGWVGERMRGNSSLQAAADCVIGVAKADRRHLVRCEKQRNGAPFTPFEFELFPVGDSCVMRRLVMPLSDSAPSRTRTVMEHNHRLGRITALVLAAENRAIERGDEGYRATVTLVIAEFPDIPEKTLRDDLARLVERNQIAQWNRPVPGFSRRLVFGIHQRCEADCVPNSDHQTANSDRQIADAEFDPYEDFDPFAA